MSSNTPRVQRRTIGKVSVFDLFGKVEGSLVEGIKEYIECYIKECSLQHVVLNIQSVNTVEKDVTQSIFKILEMPKKTAIYSDSSETLEKFVSNQKLPKRIHSCLSQKDVIDTFSREFIERDKEITFQDRRESVRFKTALDAKVNFVDKGTKEVLKSDAIVTNLSGGGVFVEYLDLKSAFKLEDLGYFKNLLVNIDMEDPDKSSDKRIKRVGSILRIEFNGSQAGVAIQFD